ncbi:MAG TPA: CBS domain-containing protein [Candidatus Dormibacteraeota bacterium]|nr:CBS domain-containing protein [Candidatus Dormibacteraeota bacterium]
MTLPRHRTVETVMTVRVHVAGPQTPFKHLVRMIEENRISAVPIVDQQGAPIGVVSEGDLLLKERRGELESADSPLHLWRRRVDRAKAEGVIASDLMTAPAITVPVGTPIAAAARLMQERNVRRLIVVNELGRIAGIVTRSDLLQVFLRTDEEIRDEAVNRILPMIVPMDAPGVEVEVESGVLTLAGVVDRRSDHEIVERLSREIDGAVDVVNHLTYRWDDTKVERETL